MMMTAESQSASQSRMHGALHGFAPEAKSLLSRPIGKTEKHRLALRGVRHRLPRRRDEDVARTPRERLIADAARAAPLGDAEHGRVGRPVLRGLEARRQD